MSMTQPMTVPTIHLNGTARDSLLDAHCEAGRAVRVALDAIELAAPNPRDYYPQGDDAFASAKREHADRVGRLRSVLVELEALAEAIAG
jgi:hypothetical protein